MSRQSASAHQYGLRIGTGHGVGALAVGPVRPCVAGTASRFGALDGFRSCLRTRTTGDGRRFVAASSTLNLGNDQREQLPIDGRGALQIDADQIPDANFGAE